MNKIDLKYNQKYFCNLESTYLILTKLHPYLVLILKMHFILLIKENYSDINDFKMYLY